METLPDLGDWIDIALWRTSTVSILFVGGDGGCRQAHDLAGKRALVENRYSCGALLALWTGKWRTSARTVTAEQRAAVLDALS